MVSLLTVCGEIQERRAEGGGKGEVWRKTAIEIPIRLRVGRAIKKTEGEVAPELMKEIKRFAPDEGPPAIYNEHALMSNESLHESPHFYVLTMRHISM